jgi:diguanylate cyclase (GGDEF)-like protein
VSHWMESQLRPFLVRDGTADGLMLSLRLIDDRVAMEHELHEEVQRKLLESAELVANLRCELEKWQWLDPTTGLPNRAATLRQIQQLIAGPEARTLAIINLEIDNFQRLNNGFGSEHCSHLLCAVGDALRRQLHDADWLALIGPDEFLVIRADIASIEQAWDLAQQLQWGLATCDQLSDEHNLGIPVSIGVSLWPEHASSAEGLLQAANTALTDAKQRGSRQLRLYSTHFSERIQERIQMELALERSLRAKQLSIVYQPQVTSQGLIVGAEALLRWHTSDGIAISPVKFIPVAEETGLILPIGEWLIDSCFRQLAKWRDAGLPKLRLAINLSPVQLEDPGGRLSRFVLECLERHGIDPEMVEFELTEMAIQKDPEALSREFHALAKAGFRLALDDFGTGYSTLELLHRLPFHKLKIERCFVVPLLRDDVDLTIVHASLLMAQRLGLSTVAEGVSNSNQVRLLAGLGCELFQGHLYSPPVSAEKLKAMLRIGFIIPNEPER